jgi:FkbM family methyltransferase
LIKNINESAYQKRESLNSENYFSIQELTSLPPLFDFVDCIIDKESKFQMFLAGKDDGVALRFFWNGMYEKKTLSIWSKLAGKAKGFILDIGAHTGVFSLAALSSNNKVNILSFEPHFMNFSRLLLNLRANQFSNFQAFMFCVGSSNCIVPFSISTDLFYLTTGGSVGNRENAMTSSIQQVALDNFLSDDIIENISLIKIDVEGYEPNCFLGMHKILKNCPIIFFECINTESGQKVQEILSKYNYKFYEVDDLNGSIKPVNKVVAHYHDGKVLMNMINRIASVKPII